MKTARASLIITAVLAMVIFLPGRERTPAGRSDDAAPAAQEKLMPGAPADAFLPESEEPSPGGATALVTIAREANHLYDEKTIVEYHPSGAIYVAFNDNNLSTNKRSVLLYKYEGGRVSFVKNVSESNLMAYEPDMVITADGWIHMAWAEAASANADTQYVKYRYFNGSSWSAVQTLRTQVITGTVTGHNVEKIDDLRLAVDNNRNLFVVYMIWPAARCQSLSRYGSQVYIENWPAGGRTKHGGVAVDSSYVHLTWVGLVDGQYWISYGRRSNKAGSAWSLVQNIQNSVNGVVDRPFIRVNAQHVPQLAYLKTTPDDDGRHIYHRSWTGSAFSSAFQVSSQNMAYHPPEIAALDNNNLMISAQTWAGSVKNFYNWKKNGKWGGFSLLNTAPTNQSYGDCALHSNGEAAIAYAAGASCMLAVLESTGTPLPPDPTPEPDPNLPPTARFSFSPISGLFPLDVTFNATSSKDSDGTIVSYHWDFGDGGAGSGAIVHHVYNREDLFEITLRIADDDGATASATGEIEVFGVAPPLKLAYQRYENRNLFSVEYLYRVTWEHNPRNDRIGAKIAHYKIFRREVGKGGFAHFHTVQAGNFTVFEYLDRSLGSSPHVYEYAVSAVDTGGRESTWAQ